MPLCSPVGGPGGGYPRVAHAGSLRHPCSLVARRPWRQLTVRPAQGRAWREDRVSKHLCLNRENFKSYVGICF